MTAWSCLRRLPPLNAKQITQFGQKSPIGINALQCRYSGGHGPRLMPITASRWQWHKFKDMVHYYLMVGLIPVGLIIFYANVFVGPATLSEIPEGYVPKHWEYHKHPISRFLARYLYNTPQQDYEKFMHMTYEEAEKAEIRRLTDRIEDKMYQRQDYQGFYYRPVSAKYIRIAKKAADELKELEDES